MSSAPNTNPLSYNQWVQQVGVLAVELTSETAGVYSFNSAPLEQSVPQILNYAELRIQRDLDLLASQTSNLYTLTAGQQALAISINDFLTVQTIEAVQTNGGTVVSSVPLLPVSKEMIQNVYGGLVGAGLPMYFAMYGDAFGDGANSNNTIIFGPVPSYAFQLRVTGTIRTPSLYSFASSGPADAGSTYISTYYPDMLVMASMIFVSAYQRNFSATSDSPDMGQSYEKQYQALLPSALAEENRKKFMGSGWSSYSTPATATATR
jgi:hypothetical protein